MLETRRQVQVRTSWGADNAGGTSWSQRGSEHCRISGEEQKGTEILLVGLVDAKLGPVTQTKISSTGSSTGSSTPDLLE